MAGELTYAVLGLLAPVAVLGIVIYLAVRLAIRHENRDRPK